MAVTELLTCQISQIIRTHTKLSELINELKLPPLVSQYTKELSSSALMSLLEIYPISVKKTGKDNFECIGGIRQFLLAQCMFQSDVEIPVLCHPGKLKLESMQRRVLVELYHLPLLLGVYQGDSRMARAMVSSLDELDPDLVKKMGLDTKVLQAYWSGVSERTIKRG